MKVKIGNKIVDSKDEPIMLIFENEKETRLVAKELREMAADSRKYCMFPTEDMMWEKEAEEFIKTK